MIGAERTKMFDFDNSRLLEKALKGKRLYRKLLLLTKLLKSTKSTKTTSQNVEEISFGRIFVGAHTVQTALN